MSANRRSLRWLAIGAGIVLLTVGLAGCTSSEDTSVVDPGTSDCPARGSDAPTEITDTYLSQDQTWSPDSAKRVDYKVTTDLNLYEYTLTIEPCTIVEMGPDTKIEAPRDGAKLLVQGAEREQVHIKGTTEDPGHWTGIKLHMSETDGHVLEHVVVEHATGTGFGHDGGVEIQHFDSDSTLTIQNAAIQTTEGTGLYFEHTSDYDQAQGAPNLAFQDNTFTNNTGAGVVTWAHLAEHLDAGSDYSGNDGPGVRVTPSTLTSTHTWDDLGVPYQVAASGYGELMIDGKFTLQPGVQVAFEDGEEGIHVRGNDDSVTDPGLYAKGTPQDRVKLTSASGTIGGWEGVIVSGEGTKTELEHTIVAFGGSKPHGFGDHHKGANLVLVPSNNGENFEGYDVDLDDVHVKLSSEDGMQIGSKPGIDLTMNNAEIALNENHPIAVRNVNVEDLASDTTFTGNAKPGVKLLGTLLPEGDVTIPPLETYYVPEGSLRKTAGTVTLPAGTDIRFPDDATFHIDSESFEDGHGTIKAQGTDGNPVDLQGLKGHPGEWKGLYLQTGSTDNALEHTRIRHGGSGSHGASTCGSSSAMQGGNLIIGDCSRSDPADRGKIEWRSGSSTKHPQTTDSGSRVAGIWANHCSEISINTSGSPQVRYTSFVWGDSHLGQGCPPQSN